MHHFAVVPRDDHSSRPHLAMRLQQPTRGFSFQPAWADRKEAEAQRAGPALPSYLVLHHAGFAVPTTLLPPRWALTPPFHPYLRANHADIPKVCLRSATGLRSAGGIFSVALSVTPPLARLRPLALPGALPTPLARFRCPDFPPASPLWDSASDRPAHPPFSLYRDFVEGRSARRTSRVERWRIPTEAQRQTEVKFL